MRSPTEEDTLTVCRECDTLCYYWEISVPIGGGETEVIDAHWSHVVHPEDDHDVVPVEAIEE